MAPFATSLVVGGCCQLLVVVALILPDKIAQELKNLCWCLGNRSMFLVDSCGASSLQNPKSLPVVGEVCYFEMAPVVTSPVVGGCGASC